MRVKYEATFTIPAPHKIIHPYCVCSSIPSGRQRMQIGQEARVLSVDVVESGMSQTGKKRMEWVVDVRENQEEKFVWQACEGSRLGVGVWLLEDDRIRV